MEKIENVEIITMDNTDLSTIDENFLANMERIDFDNPKTLLTYGSNLLNEISEMTQSVTKMISNDEEVEVNLDVNVNECIRDLGRFDTALEKVDKYTTKAKNKGVVGFIASTVDKLSKAKKEESGTPTYLAEFEEYCKKVDTVAEILESQKNGILLDIEISDALIKKLREYIPKLQILIKALSEDIAQYEEDVVEPLKIDTETSKDNPLVAKQYAVAKQKLDLAEKKLYNLEENLVKIKERIAESEITQINNMNLCTMHESYLRDNIPALKIQASSMLQVKRQEKKIQKYQLLVDVTNEAFKTNSETLKANVQNVTELATSGDIKIETYKEINKNIAEAAKLIQKGTDERIQKRRKNMDALQEISRSIDEYNNSIRNAMAMEAIDYGAVLDMTSNKDYTNSTSTGAYVKGSKNG